MLNLAVGRILNLEYMPHSRGFVLWGSRRTFFYPATGRGGPRGSGSVKAPDFLDVRHYEDGRSSTIRTGRLYARRNPGTHFQRLSRPQDTCFRRGEPRKKKSSVTPRGIFRLVAQCLNHYATRTEYGLSQNLKEVLKLFLFQMSFVHTNVENSSRKHLCASL